MLGNQPLEPLLLLLANVSRLLDLGEGGLLFEEADDFGPALVVDAAPFFFVFGAGPLLLVGVFFEGVQGVVEGVGTLVGAGVVDFDDFAVGVALDAGFFEDGFFGCGDGEGVALSGG